MGRLEHTALDMATVWATSKAEGGQGQICYLNAASPHVYSDTDNPKTQLSSGSYGQHAKQQLEASGALRGTQVWVSS